MINPALIISIAIATTNIIQCTAEYYDYGDHGQWHPNNLRGGNQYYGYEDDEQWHPNNYQGGNQYYGYEDDGQWRPNNYQSSSYPSQGRNSPTWNGNSRNDWSENAHQTTSGPRGSDTLAGNFQAGFGGVDQLGTAAADTPIVHDQPLTDSTAGEAELRRSRALSTPAQCERSCKANEKPKICYYHFTLEQYTVLGAACQLCRPNGTSYAERESCQCVLADGFERGILTANRMIPGPSIQVCKNDRVVIDVENHIPGAAVAIHWHGIWQNGSQYYDGVPFVTQCPILEGTTFRYQWTAGNAGTHFWHAHTGVHKMDGLHGSLIVREPRKDDPNRDLYDVDDRHHVILVADWYHERVLERFPGLLNRSAGQAPDNILINGKGTFTDPTTNLTTDVPLEEFRVIPGKRYRFRFINSFGSVCPAQINIEGHVMTVIATDGEPVEPVQVRSIVSFSGERYDFVVHANQLAKTYWIQLRALGGCGIPRIQNLAILRYQGQDDRTLSAAPAYDTGLPQGVVLNPLDGDCETGRDDAICVSDLRNPRRIDRRLLREQPDVKIYLPFRFFYYRPDELFQPKTYNRFLVAPTGDHMISLIDEMSYVSPKSPPLSQPLPDEEFCNGVKRPASCGENCQCPHTLNVPLGSVVELVIVDEVQQANLSHPFHLHGYAFNVLCMGRSPDENVKKITLKHVMDIDSRGLVRRRFAKSPGKDTIAVPNNGYVVVRFIANNPGYWFLHCHFQPHILIGMNVILKVGERSDLPPVPPGFPTCGDHLPPINGISTPHSSSDSYYGNFHGHSLNWKARANTRRFHDSSYGSHGYY